MEQDQRRPLWAVLMQLAAVVMLAGCSTAVGLSETPNLYLGGRTYPDRAVPAVLQVTDPPMFFVTDRDALGAEGRVTGYGTGRSDAMAFGRAQVEFQAADWEDLVARTYVDRGRRMSRLDVVALEEMVRFPLIPLAAERRDGGLRVKPDAQASYTAQSDAFKAAIRAEVKRTGNGRVLVYVHGVSNDFENALQTLANLWHFSGRRSVPVTFTWPAGNGGALGYFRDREAADERARGNEAAQRIQAQADRTVIELVSDAERQGQIIQGEADARRNEIFASAFGEDPEFFEFYRSMTAYQRSLRPGKSTMVLSPDSDFFNYLKSDQGAAASQ